MSFHSILPEMIGSYTGKGGSLLSVTAEAGCKGGFLVRWGSRPVTEYEAWPRCIAMMGLLSFSRQCRSTVVTMRGSFRWEEPFFYMFCEPSPRHLFIAGEAQNIFPMAAVSMGCDGKMGLFFLTVLWSTTSCLSAGQSLHPSHQSSQVHSPSKSFHPDNIQLLSLLDPPESPFLSCLCSLPCLLSFFSPVPISLFSFLLCNVPASRHWTRLLFLLLVFRADPIHFHPERLLSYGTFTISHWTQVPPLFWVHSHS